MAGPKSMQHTYLVDVCDESKDRYRFGFNGQEKVNEIAGVGNHNTAQFWEYDTRLGRRWNPDPVVKPWESSYAAFNNSPLIFADPSGRDGIVTGTGSELDPLVIKAEYITNGLDKEQQGAFDEAVKQYNNGGNSWKIGIEDGSNIYVRFDLSTTHMEGLSNDDLEDKAMKSNQPNSDGASTNFYGNFVTPGKVEGNHFAAANNISIIFDASAMQKYINKNSSGSEQGNKNSYSKLLIHLLFMK